MQMTFLFHAATCHPGGFYYWNVYFNKEQFVCEELQNLHVTVLIDPVEIGVSVVDDIDDVKSSIADALASATGVRDGTTFTT